MVSGKRGPTQFFTPDAVYMTTDGGEWCVRKMANGFHVLGPWTVDSYGAWPSLDEAKKRLVERAGEGAWDSKPARAEAGR
jgi:hypothetical protein